LDHDVRITESDKVVLSPAASGAISYLGAQDRRLRARLGAPKAITAMTHKLARLVYRMLKWGHEYVDKGLQYYEERHREQQVLKKRAAKLGLQILEPEAA
jgi:transposase